MQVGDLVTFESHYSATETLGRGSKYLGVVLKTGSTSHGQPTAYIEWVDTYTPAGFYAVNILKVIDASR